MPQDDRALLSRLQTHHVDFVVIGGVCGLMHGVPLVTRDLDICCSFTTENLRRLESAVRDLHPFHRLAANKLPLQLTDELCSRLKNLDLHTDLGTLDCLSEVSGIGSYEQALERSVTYHLSYGDFRILSIDALIAAKEAIGRERDREADTCARSKNETSNQKAGSVRSPSTSSGTRPSTFSATDGKTDRVAGWDNAAVPGRGRLVRRRC